ncbi:FecR domain-containing protein [Noviherbaspirillum sp. 17J57-3]|uniref:FecR domain-containing protein n=1 Tax=Noviherbaspirillum galbum TaxID=2709383 RepID=A0A6B3SQ89_9BURK|nr:FecR domain-containing protein [Noviherbaspirillum galbum]
MRKIILSALLLCSANAVLAGEAARVVFVAGQTVLDGKPAELGRVVNEGDEISTQGDGYVYLKTVDNGFLILRPNSRARITAYHIDKANPSNTRVKLELLNGVARSISGEAVKEARQNFRFNTPVAAIGVRGTDFTVFTDQETSRVAVISGGIVVSGFTGACGPEGTGPCEGKSSRELFASQVGQLLQVRKGQSAPQILPSSGISPDVAAPPRNDEPIGKSTSGSMPLPFNVADVSLDPLKNLGLLARFQQFSSQQAQQPAVVTPPVAVTPTPTQEVVPETSKIVWGRWQPIVDQSAAIDLAKMMNEKNTLNALNSYFAVLRTQGTFTMPATGNVGFGLKNAEAYILDEPTNKFSVASYQNGKLQVDFAKSSFNTSFDVVSQKNERFSFQSVGEIDKNGKMVGGNQFIAPTNVSVSGALGDNGNSAAYIFQGRVDDRRVTTGVTYWTR